MIIQLRHSAYTRTAARRHYKWWIYLTGGVAGLLILVYIGLVNDVSTQGYRLQGLQQEVKRLEQGNTAIEIQLAAAQSLQRLESESGSLALVPLEHTEYLDVPTTSVAVR